MIENSILNSANQTQNPGQLPNMPPHISQDFQLFEMVHKDDFLQAIVNSQALRTAHYEFLSQIRLTDYQSRFDTITVSEKLVSDPKHFFKLLGTVTSNCAFKEQLSFSNRLGRAQIDSPQWLDKVDSAQLTVWIAGLLEENLWAHYNYAHNTNFEKNVRKNEINNLFETRSETLQSQEVLAKHWHEIGNKSRQRLIEKLRQKAKEIPIMSQDQSYLFGGAEQYLSFEQAYGSDFGGSPFVQDETNSFYASQLGLSRGYLNYNGLPHDEMGQVFTNQTASATANTSQQHPFAAQLGQGNALASQQINLRPYQFYQMSDIPIRSHYSRMYQELLLSKDSNDNQANATAQNDIGVNQSSMMSSSNLAPVGKSQKDQQIADPDLKQITSYISQKENIVSSMDVIKFLSETSLDELSHFALPDKTRKNTLCRELLTYIQDDLRNHIQNQLIDDKPTGSSSSQLQASSFLGGSQSKQQTSQSNSQMNSYSSSGQKSASVVPSTKDNVQSSISRGGNKNLQDSPTNTGGAVNDKDPSKSSSQQPSASSATQNNGKTRNKRKNRRKGMNMQAPTVSSQTATPSPPKGDGVQKQTLVTSQTEQQDLKIELEKNKKQQFSQVINLDEQQLPTETTTSKKQVNSSTKQDTTILASANNSKVQNQKTAVNSNNMRFNRKTLESDSKSQKVSTGGYENLKHASGPKKLKQAIETDDEKAEQKLSCSDLEDAEESIRSVGSRRKNFGQTSDFISRTNFTATKAHGETTLDTKNTTQMTSGGSQSARKEHNHSAANLFQLTASQSVDLIKPTEQMRDKSDQKAFSTKSLATLSTSKAAQNHDKSKADIEDVNNISLSISQKKRRSSNQRRKKSNNGSSNSRSKNSSQDSQKNDSRTTTILVKEFVEQLIERAINIASTTVAEDHKPRKSQPISTKPSQKKHQEESKQSQQQQQQQRKQQPVLLEDLGTIFARQELDNKTKMQQKQQKQEQQKKTSFMSPRAATDHNNKGHSGHNGGNQPPRTNNSKNKQNQNNKSSTSSVANIDSHVDSKSLSEVKSSQTSTANNSSALKQQLAVEAAIVEIYPKSSSKAKGLRNVGGEDSLSLAAVDVLSNQSNEEITKTEGSKDNSKANQLRSKQAVSKDVDATIEQQDEANQSILSSKEAGATDTSVISEKQNAAKPKRKRKKNDKLDAMNNFLLKMHGDGPPAASANNGNGNSSSNQNKNKQGNRKNQNNDDKSQQNHNNKNNKDNAGQRQNNNNNSSSKGAQSSQGASQGGHNQKNSTQQQADDHQKVVKSGQTTGNTQSSNNNKQSQQAATRAAKTTDQPTGVSGNASSSASGNQRNQQPSTDQLRDLELLPSQQTASSQVTEMQKYASFTNNESSQNEFLSIPSRIMTSNSGGATVASVGATSASAKTAALQSQENLHSEKDGPQGQGSKKAAVQAKSAATASQQSIIETAQDSSQSDQKKTKISVKASSIQSTTSLQANNSSQSKIKKEKVDIKIDLAKVVKATNQQSQSQSKNSAATVGDKNIQQAASENPFHSNQLETASQKAENNSSSSVTGAVTIKQQTRQQQSSSQSSQRHLKQSTDNVAIEKQSSSSKVQGEINNGNTNATTTAAQGKKLNSKQQIESAKADFRARFFELERQRTAEIMDQSQSSLKEEIKVGEQQRSEEIVAVKIECLDTSDSKQDCSMSATDLNDVVPQLQSFDLEARLGGDHNKSTDEEEKNLFDQQSIETESRVSASEISVSTAENPFMSTRAQSFMPTTFVPSPNKLQQSPGPMLVQSQSFSPDFSPMKMQFGQSATVPPHSSSKMPFKSLSVMDVTRDEFQNSARSNGSNNEDNAAGQVIVATATDGGFVPNAAVVTTTNPFKQQSAQLLQQQNNSQGKHKSMAVSQIGGPFAARQSHSNSFSTNINNDSGTGGLKIKDGGSSPFTFQPHNNSLPFNAIIGASNQNTTFGSAVFPTGPSLDDSLGKPYNTTGNHWEGKDRSSKHHHGHYSKHHMDGGIGSDGHPIKKKTGPFNKQLSKFSNQAALDRNTHGFGDFDGGKSHYHKSKAQYQAINRGSNERQQPFGGEETKSNYKGKNNNRMHLDFSSQKDRSQNSPHKIFASTHRQLSGDKKTKQKSLLEAKGPKSTRYKNPSKGSPDQGYSHGNGDEYDDDRNLQKQNSHDSQYSGQPNISLGQTNNNTNSVAGSTNEVVWQTSPRDQNFTPTNFNNNHYHSPMQMQPQINFNNFTGNNAVGFGGNFNNYGQNQMSGYQQEDDYISQVPMQNPPQLPVYSPFTSDRDASKQGSMSQNVASAPIISNNTAERVRQMVLPREEEIFKAAQVAISKIDFDKLPAVEQDTFIDPQAKKDMEADDVYKMLENRFYREFDQHIIKHTSAISAMIESYSEERSFVKDRIEKLAKDELKDDRIFVEIFGSLKTGLALEQSDMDMAIRGLDISDRTTLIEDMHTLTQALDSWDLIEELKSIETASIPVIKAQIDLNKIRKLIKKQKRDAEIQTSDCDDDHQQESKDRKQNSTNDQEIQEDDENEEPHWLPIDITFDDSQPDSTTQSSGFEAPNMMQPDPFGLNFGLGVLGGLTNSFNNAAGFGGLNTPKTDGFFGFPTAQPKTHLGMESCKLLKQYTATYPCLKEVGILLKEFLSLHDLNSAYRGGISSYSAILLIVAYMNNFNLQQSRKITPSRLLMGFLDFYSNCFDAKLYGINTLLPPEMSFYSLPPQSQPMFVIVDPVNSTNNTSRNSHKTTEILKKFQEAFSHLKSLIQGEYLRMQGLKQEQQKHSASIASMEGVTSAENSQAQAIQSIQGYEDGSSRQPVTHVEESQLHSTEGYLTETTNRDKSNPAGNDLPQASQQVQQQNPPASQDQIAEQSTGIAYSSSGPQTSLASQQIVNEGDSKHEKLEKLPYNPFFFATADFIRHLYFKREENSPLVLPASGESRPGILGTIKDDDDPQQARSSSNEAASQ